MGTKVTGSGLSVVTSPFLDPLTDDLADRLGVPLPDPFTTELVVVPNIGVRDWLQRELSGRLGSGRAGIVANVRFMFVQQFLDIVFSAAGTSPVEPTDVASWDIEHLTWVVHRAIDTIGRDSIPGANAKPLTAARIVADLLDRYAVHRPSMLRYWRNGRAIDAVEPIQDLPDHMRWQQRVYAEVSRLVSRESPSDRLAGLEDVVRENGLSDAIPERVTLFGFSTVNATARGVLSAVATARDCRLYLLHPERSATSSGAGVADRLVPRDHDLVDDSGNPLLSRWGRPARETSRVLGGTWQHVAEPAEPMSSDLARLRAAIVDDVPLSLAPVSDESPELTSGDGSIQVHACHGRVRQVEVLRDAILHVLEDDPSLTLDEIAIQCPDLVGFAPIIPAIFRSGQPAVQGATPPLDVSVADRVLTGENPYHDTFWSLLETGRSRCGVADVLTVLSCEPIRRRFEIDDDAMARLADWFDTLGVRFGLDTQHRRRWSVPESIDVGTWDTALDRLFMGLAIPAPELFEGPGGIVPHDDIAVTDVPTLARATEFLTRLRRLVLQLETAHTVEEWSKIFESIVEDFFDVSEQRDFACRDLLDASDRLRRAADQAGVGADESFEMDEISAILADLVVSSSSRPRFRSGAITVTELLPQQGVPYRVIALLGVSEEMFSGGGLRGDDVLSLRPCLGDPMPSASGRLQLLNVLLATRDSVIITCDGADISNNKPIPLPVPIQELLEATAAIRRGRAEAGPMNVFTRHPRQGHSVRALSTGHVRSDRPFTFDRVALDVVTRRSGSPEPILAERLDVPPGGQPVRIVTVEDLRSAVTKPADYFVQNVLSLRLPSSDVGGSNDFVDFWPSNLDVARAGRELLDAAMRSPDEPRQTMDHVLRHLALADTFPPGRLGDMAARQVSNEVLAILELLPEAARRATDFRSIEIETSAVAENQPGVSPRNITGIVGDILGFDVVRASFTRFREDLVLGPWIDLALLGCADPDSPWCVRLVARGSKGEAKHRSFSLAGTSADERRRSGERAIGVAATLIACMERGRIPFLPKTSERLSRSSVESTRSTYESEGEFSPSTQFLFGRVTWDEFVSERPTDFDPDPASTSRAQMFAQFVWRAFHETTVRSDVPWSAS